MSQKINEKPLTHYDLAHYHGGLEERYRSINRRVIYTPGVSYLANKGGAHWLIDAIASYYGTPEMKRAIRDDYRLETLHFWRLDVLAESAAILTARADRDALPFITQEIPFTDFPLDHVRVWSGFDGEHWTLYLPSEH